MRAIFSELPISLNYVEGFLGDNDISYQIWENGDEREIRIDLSELNEDELELLKKEFGINDILNIYDYFILWQ